MTKISLAGLRRFNLLMAALHAGQAALVVWLSRDFTLPVRVAYLTYDASSQSLQSASRTIVDLPLAWLVAAFLIISSLAHLIIATINNQQYGQDLRKGLNRARWYEYALSASTMMVAIAMLVGIYDLASLVMIFALVAGMNLMGLVMEVYNQDSAKPNWLAYNIGCILGIVPWLAIALYFWSAEYYGAGNIPTFVYWIYGTIFVFFNIFALNMWAQYKKIGPWQDYLFGERVYIWLSLIAKSALAWQVFAGTLRP